MHPASLKYDLAPYEWSRRPTKLPPTRNKHTSRRNSDTGKHDSQPYRVCLDLTAVAQGKASLTFRAEHTTPEPRKQYLVAQRRRIYVVDATPPLPPNRQFARLSCLLDRTAGRRHCARYSRLGTSIGSKMSLKIRRMYSKKRVSRFVFSISVQSGIKNTNRPTRFFAQNPSHLRGKPRLTPRARGLAIAEQEQRPQTPVKARTKWTNF